MAALGFVRRDDLERIERRLDTFATRADLQATEQRLETRIDATAAKTEASVQRWMVGVAVALVAAAVLIFVATAVDGFVGNPVNAENPVGWAVFGVVFMMGLIGVMYWLGAEEGGR